MGEGLFEYKQNDRIFNMAFLHRLIITGAMTGIYFVIAKRSNFFRNKQQLNLSVPLATLAAFYFSKGIALSYLGLKHSAKLHNSKVKNNLDHYHHKLREQKLI